MLGQLRKAIERSYIRGKAPNLNRLSRARKERSRPQPNSVFAQFSVVCMFNWMLGQLRKGCGKVVCSWKSSEFKSAEQCEGKCHKPSPSAQFSVRAIPIRVYVQLDARPIEEGCGKVVSLRRVVYSWKSSESESAEQREGKEIKPRSQPNSVFVRFSVI